MPPLRERQEDIPLLAKHFLAEAAKELNVDVKQLDKEAEDYLLQLEWPGNVRQLENTCRWLTVMSPGQNIHMDNLPVELKQTNNQVSLDNSRDNNWEDSLRDWVDTLLTNGELAILDKTVPRFERIMIEIALKHTGGRKQDAAKLLGWGRNTLTRKIKELEIDHTSGNNT